MTQLTTIGTVLMAVFIWWAVLNQAHAQYYIDDYQMQQALRAQQDAINEQMRFNQSQQELRDSVQRTIQMDTRRDGNYCYQCNGTE